MWTVTGKELGFGSEAEVEVGLEEELELLGMKLRLWEAQTRWEASKVVQLVCLCSKPRCQSEDRNP